MDRIDRLKAFLAATPDDSFLKHALALEMIKKGDEASARKEFEDILNKDPGYVGSYYHLAKLLERMGDTDNAISWYKKGMEKAEQAGDRHALNELRAAYEELTDEN